MLKVGHQLGRNGPVRTEKNRGDVQIENGGVIRQLGRDATRRGEDLAFLGRLCATGEDRQEQDFGGGQLGADCLHDRNHTGANRAKGWFTSVRKYATV